ncbi:hypothetical protein PSACC_00879 [Paramicrosporidium saccamoebae]|uniref:Uncharacterized protein n=1 Tax=Paramicrosporidium saccamoebae TaxID=1246581 RepID=A0A2H9TNN9_9FUNG|nr:hypothetical protein PSACC_00879 [Paramicrosporidium saccamoebae]
MDIQSISTEAQREAILVNFDKKGWDEKKQEYVGIVENLKPEDPFEFLAKLYNVPKPETLIEYVDEFGRTRLIGPGEKARRDAEQEETRQLLLKFDQGEHFDEPAQPLHYEADREIRNKGVGFFLFSKDEQERQRQMRALDELRNNTVEQRKKALIGKEQKRLRAQSRMALIQARRKKYETNLSRGHD